jgi:branched-chain amino acid transport system substrate-binding protein
MLARALARYASEDVSSGARVSGIDPDFIWGQSNWNAFQEEITDVADAEIVEHLWPDQGTREFGPFISQLEEIDPDVIFTSLFGSGLVAFTQQADSAGLFEDRLVVSAQYGMTIGNQLTDQSPTGLITAAIGYWYDLDNPTNNRFREDYLERYGSLPPGKAAGNYTAVKMLADAANKAGTVEDTEKIISTLENNSWDTAYGNLGFRKLDHQGYNPVPVGRMVGGDEPNWLRMEDKRIYPAEDVIRPTSEMKEIFCTGSTDNQELQSACDSY